MRLAFNGISATIEVPDCPIFLQALQSGAPLWPLRPAEDPGDPVSTIVKEGVSYLVAAPGEDAIRTTAVGAAAAAIADLAMALIDENPERLCLHGASALINGRLIVFPSRSHAGKSTLIARLAASGHTIFCDDILPLSADDESGVALGLAPRLRLPLPENASPAFRAFTARHAGASDGRYLFLDLPAGLLAPKGTGAPLGAIVLLDRSGDGSARQEAAGLSTVLQAIVTQNAADTLPAGDLLVRLRRLAERLPRFTLVYRDLEAAAALIEATFSTWPPRAVAAGGRAGQFAGIERIDGHVVPADRPMRQSAGVRLETADGELFLAGGADDGIYHLDAIGAGVWALLAEPLSLNAAAKLIAEAFPEIEPATIERDVAALFAALASAGLIAPAY